MSEYKENTVGWWLSQLKEPLRSRALESVKEDETDTFLANSLTEAIDVIIDAHPWMENTIFWRGVSDFFHGESQLSSEDEYGWDMARECAPETEGVVLPRSVTEVIGNSERSKPGSFTHYMANRPLTEHELRTLPSPDEIGEITPKAVEGYAPPRCITESERLHDALKRISELEKIVFRLLSNEKRS